MANEYLAIAFDEIDQHIADRLRTCSTRLVYGVDADKRKRLRVANFCRVRLCPICQWRRSLKLYGQMMRVMRYLEPQGYRYIFLTLTVRNTRLDDLTATLDALVEGYKRLVKYDEVKAACRGWYRGTEITHNLDRTSDDYDTYHPHIHVVIAVNPSYFTSRDYLSQQRWTDLWQRALGVDYAPRVDVRKITGTTAQAVCEATKYAAKSKDYIILDDWDLTVETVRGLHAALFGRRLVGFGGCLLAARRALKQDDIDSGDLVATQDDESNAKDVYYESYAWHSGYSQYARSAD